MISHLKWICNGFGTDVRAANTAWKIKPWKNNLIRMFWRTKIWVSFWAERAVICAKTSEVMERPHQPGTSLASAAFRSGRHDWEQKQRSLSFHLTWGRKTDRWTDKAGASVSTRACSCVQLCAARCPPLASIRTALTSVLSPLTYMATRNGAKLPLEQPLGPPWILSSLVLPSNSAFSGK